MHCSSEHGFVRCQGKAESGRRGSICRRSRAGVCAVKKPNGRSLADIATDINKIERGSIFDLGDLLIEARVKIEHGGWLDWIEAEFDYSPDTAENYMGAANLALKYRTVRLLKVPASIIYNLADVDDDLVPDAIAALEGAASKGRVTAEQGRRIVELVSLRSDHGDLPDETLQALDRVKSWRHRYGVAEAKIVAALKREEPTTREAADSIIEALLQQHIDETRERSKAEKAEAEDILDGPPPELPSPQPQDEPPKLTTEAGAQTSAWQEDFDKAVGALSRLRTRSVMEFTHTSLDTDTLTAVADFIEQVTATVGQIRSPALQPELVTT
jgi:Protein of unknown function (DUF3102)